MIRRALAAGFMALLLVMGYGCDLAPTPTPSPIPTLTRTPIPTAVPRPTIAPTPQPPVTLRWNLGSEPTTLDPALAQSDAEVDLAKQLFLGLTAYDPATGAPMPELATHWDVSADGRVYTFHLRSDVLWARYHPQSSMVEPLRPVTAHDVVYSLRRAVHPGTGAPDAHLLYLIQNAEAIHTTPITGTCDVKSLGVAALDDHTVRFTLARPATYLPAILAMPVARPVRPEVDADMYRWGLPWFFQIESLITNGPYVLADCEHKFRSKDSYGLQTSLLMKKNKRFYDADRVQIDELHLFIAESQTTAMAMYENDELDNTVVPNEELECCRHPPWQREIYLVYTGGVRYFGFNLSKPPLDNVHVRRALSYALDRKTTTEAILRDGSRPAKSFAPPGIFGSTADDPRWRGVEFDPDMARKELAQAGYQEGAGFPRITLLHPATELDTKIAQHAQLDLAEYLGIEVALISEEEWRADPQHQPPHIWLGHWRGGYPDQHAYIHEVLDSDLWVELNGPDHEAIRPLRELTTAAGKEPFPDCRLETYEQAESLLINDICVVAALCYDRQVIVTKPWLHRDYPIMSGQNFKDWWMEPHE